MHHTQLMTEEQIHAQADLAETRTLLPELLLRLISASVQNPSKLRIPYGGSANQRSWDGVVDSPTPFDPYVPSGPSYWEIGTGADPQSKATEDFAKRSSALPPEAKKLAAFVFVTARSALHAWPENEQEEWIRRRKDQGWREIRIIDATKLAQWLQWFPAIDFWLAERCGIPTKGLSIPSVEWTVLQDFGSPPKLTPNVFLVGRQMAVEQLRKVFRGDAPELLLETHYPGDGIDFVIATLASLELQEQSDFASRCLIFDDPDTWKSMSASLRTPHVFVARPSLDLSGDGADLRGHARTHRHSVIFEGERGATHGNSVRLTEAKPYDLEKALTECGYLPERARRIADKCDGRHVVMKRLLLGLSASPHWTAGTAAAELALAILIGQWDGHVEGDRRVAEECLGKAYGEWIRVLRQMTLQRDPPLIQRDDKWRFVSRFEGWRSLGAHLGDADLNRFQTAAVKLFRTVDPRLELPPEERWRASTLGKSSPHSARLRKGVAETLALLGSHHESLTSCSAGCRTGVPILVVRNVLKGADWRLWASLNDVLPLLAEAAPHEFLNAVEEALQRTEENPFRALFGQERAGIAGANYMTGLLWALETLAWCADHLTRVTVVLGSLAEIDPGGNWANRPSNSLTEIFLPWFPQTCAPLPRRVSAIETLLRERPRAGWTLLLSLVPKHHSMSSGTHKPRWRSFIPEDHTGRVTQAEYFEQVAAYSVLTVESAGADMDKLIGLAEDIDGLPPEPRKQLLTHLGSEQVLQLPEAQKARLWEVLTALVIKHRKYAEADWALRPESVTALDQAANRLRPLSPILVHRHLFTDRDSELYEERGSYQTENQKLQLRRNAAVSEVYASAGLEGVLALARTVAAPWQVGHAFGMLEGNAVDSLVLPSLLESTEEPVTRLAQGFVWARHCTKGWPWLDALPLNTWTTAQKATLFTLLPFTHDTWERAEYVLVGDAAMYWNKARVNPFEPTQKITFAVERLLANGRIRAAVQCLARLASDNTTLNPEQVIRALHANAESEEPVGTFDHSSTLDLIKWLQAQPGISSSDLSRIEWRYLRLLGRHSEAQPKTLTSALSTDPQFFAEVIRAVFRSDREPRHTATPSEQAQRLAENAFRLLSEWKTVPGMQPDGTFNASAFAQWLQSARDLTTESGHFAIAMSRVGHVLRYSPPDPGGLWIHKSIAAALNAPDVEPMRQGLRTEFYNSRGVFTFTAGRAERELFAKYRKMADDVDGGGFQRLATTLRELAASYERDAQYEESHDPHDE